MATGKNKNYVSFWFWMLVLFVTALPCLGIIMALIFAFIGENESRKNFFKAYLAWALIIFAVWVGMVVIGFSPLIVKELQYWVQQLK